MTMFLNPDAFLKRIVSLGIEYDVLLTVVGLFEIFAVVGMAMLIGTNTRLQYLGKHSLIIMALHEVLCYRMLDLLYAKLEIPIMSLNADVRALINTILSFIIIVPVLRYLDFIKDNIRTKHRSEIH